MTDAENALVVLGRLLRETVYALERGKGDTGGMPAPGSRASREHEDQSLTGEWGQAPARDASTLARIQCSGALEAAARSWYLADPDITIRERVRRYMNERLRDIHESRSFHEKLGADSSEIYAQEEAISRAAQKHEFDVQNSEGWQKVAQAEASVGVETL